jgi:uncharacterized protein YjiS (DUF1127 family)
MLHRSITMPRRHLAVASLTHSRHRSIGRALADSVSAVTFSIEARFAEAKERRRISKELSMYTDRELQELGFSRNDIPAIAAGHYRR